MTAYEIVEYLESLPKKGVIEWDLDGDVFYSLASDGEYTAVSDEVIRVRASTGYGTWTLVASDMLLRTDQVRHIRHVRDIPQ